MLVCRVEEEHEDFSSMPRRLLVLRPGVRLKCELRSANLPSSSRSEAGALREISETTKRPTASCSVEIFGRGPGESEIRLPTGRV